MVAFNDLVRRGLRDQLPEPPWRLVGYERGSGPTVERDLNASDGVTEGTLQAFVHIGGKSAGIIGQLIHVDALSVDLQQHVPEDAWFAPAPTEPTNESRSPERRYHPGWTESLQTAGGTGDLVRVGTSQVPWTDVAPASTIQDDGSPADDHTHLEIVAAAREVRRQLDGVQVPSLDAMVRVMENHCQLGHAARTTHVARPLALSYLVRSRLDEGLRLVELARRAYLQSASDALARQPQRAQRDLDEVRRLERFTAWLPYARTA